MNQLKIHEITSINYEKFSRMSECQSIKCLKRVNNLLLNNKNHLLFLFCSRFATTPTTKS